MGLGDNLRHPARATLAVWQRLARGRSTSTTNIFIACFPKSGSTFLYKTLHAVTGFEVESMTFRRKRNEQDMYLPTAADAARKNSVTQQHVRATQPNLKMLNEFNIRPVVLTRNIFDIVISLRDHFYKQGQNSPMLFVDDRFYELAESDQYDMIIDMALPWYFNFYVSWFEARRTQAIDLLWTSYEEVMADKAAAIRRILTFYSLPVNEAKVENILAEAEEKRKASRFNKGVSGRGTALLTDAQRDRVRAMTRFYPWVDFSLMGLAPQEMKEQTR